MGSKRTWGTAATQIQLQMSAKRTKQTLRFKQSEYRLAVSGKATATRINLFANLLEVVEFKDDFAALYVDDCISLDARVQRPKVSKQ